VKESAVNNYLLVMFPYITKIFSMVEKPLAFKKKLDIQWKQQEAPVDG
jgi:hypothetical protein